MVLGLLWCNVGVTATYKLERCYNYNVTPDLDELPPKFFVNISNKFDPLLYEKFEVEINSDSKTVKKYWSTPNRYVFGYREDANYYGEGVKIAELRPGGPS